MKAKATSWTVAGLGAAVSGLGVLNLKQKWGAGILGFGLAHIALGLLDLVRPTVRKLSPPKGDSERVSFAISNITVSYTNPAHIAFLEEYPF